ncbi:hypothetical protein A3K86_18430 [Photobacterium jeanii]|uniref:Peptidase S9 n=1 Tax=Photobacterium jeanii TaxID=858640 RepID=A0A178K112_9GAMM|nr:prolyl oligopeptidase family serine peptidase [Photobacterium jeanii]OAN10961.1 hypothetical protein A3K86_18430 [Photobacterium jeanii]PST90476.1 S9 family peptidase [Photobacterium jeanii]
MKLNAVAFVISGLLLSQPALSHDSVTSAPSQPSPVQQQETQQQLLPSVSDTFAWLRDDSRQSRQVRHFLTEQNQHADQALAQYHPIQQQLLQQWQDYAPQKAEKPWKIDGDYRYRFETRNDERVLVRRFANESEDHAEVIFNLTQRAALSNYYSLGHWAISPDRNTIAVLEDRRGDRNYTLSLIDIKSQKATELASGLSTEIAWTTNSDALYVVTNEAHTYRPFQIVKINRHQPANPQVIWQDDNPAWLVSLYPTGDKNYALVQSNNHDTSEQYVLSLTSGELSAPLQQREKGTEYYSDILNQQLISFSNHQGEMALFRGPLGSQIEQLTPVFVPKAGTEIKNWYLFDKGIAVILGQQGSDELVVLDQNGKERFRRPMTANGTVAWLSQNGDAKSNLVRIRSMSMTTPATWSELDIETGEERRLSQDNYPNIAPEHYHSEQIRVRANGVEVPVSLAFRHDKITADSPVFLYGYGAYGTPMKPYFMPQVISLLDQGAIYAIAHVRGGGYLGSEWYQAGKGLNKPNSIKDFVATAQVMQQYMPSISAGTGANAHSALPQPREIYAIGGSAGGTLVAAAINAAPNTFSGAVLQSPFVDVINTMSDPSLPLTQQEYQEWGNPAKTKDLAVMKTYSPYDNLKPQAYPPMLVRTGLNDSQVPYWEGAKFIAKLQALSTANAPYLLTTDFNAGHQKNRKTAMAAQAMEYAFLLGLHQQKMTSSAANTTSQNQSSQDSMQPSSS